MELNINKCPCKRTSCENHGNCKACREHHALKRNSYTTCERMELKEERRNRRKMRKAERG